MKTKIHIVSILTFAFGVLSCSSDKETIAPEAIIGCIERIITPVNGHSINNADISVVNNLFINSNIDNSKYRYYRYSHESAFQTDYSPYETFDSKAVHVEEYTNGLRNFTGLLSFFYKNDILNYKSGIPSNGTTLNTTPSLNLEQLRKLFVDSIKADPQSMQYKDNCFEAEFGYYNINVGTSNATEILVKAWKINVKKSNENSSEIPYAYYQDKDGKLIYYNNGIILN